MKLVSLTQLIAGDVIPSVTTGEIEDAVSLAPVAAGDVISSITISEIGLFGRINSR